MTRNLRLTLVGLGLLAVGPAGLRAQPAGDSLTLAQAVRLALASHPRALAARARSAAADAQVGEAAGRRFPQINLQATATRYQEPWIVAPLHGFDLTSPPTFDQTLLQGTATLAYTLFDGGARGARVGGARAQAGAAEWDVAATEAALIAEVARRYLGVLTAAGVLAAHDEGWAALRAESTRVERLLAEGRAAPVQALQVAAALAQAEAARVGAATRLEVATLDLARVIARGDSAPQPGSLRAVRLRDTTPLARVPLQAAARGGSPQVAAAREQAEGARRGRAAALAQWFPQVDLVGGYLGFASGAGDYSAEWQFGVRLSYPLFTGAARAAAVRRAGAELRAAEARVLDAETEVAGALDRALAADQEAGARVAAGIRATRHLGELTRIERLRLETGVGTETDFLRAEADFRRAQAELVEARHAAILARVEVARLTGALTEEWVATMVEAMP